MMHPRTPAPFPAGRYYVGDCCYVCTHAMWQTFPCDPDGTRSWDIPLHDQRLWMAFTAHGDGLYTDTEGREYGVDSGSIGVMPVAACHPAKLQAILRQGLGQLIDFPAPFTPTCEEGYFVIGPVVIDTRMMADNEEEETED